MPDRATLGRWVRKGLTTRPDVTAGRARDKVKARRQAGQARRDDATRPTYALDAPSDLRVGVRAQLPSIESLRAHAEVLAGVTGQFLNHRFDLLGSGWVEARHDRRCRGLGGYRYDQYADPLPGDGPDAWPTTLVSPPNATEATRIWGLIDEGYVPIDWQRDSKSGWRWSERTWSRDISYGSEPGVDVKLPWELARCQHLPRLALAERLAGAGEAGFAAPERYRREFRNQVLDFIATNPPRYGVNWTTSMDVALRLVSWLIAHDLFGGPDGFDEAFEAVFARSVVEHGRHLATHLEWSDEVRGNHYLSDLLGLIAAGAYLPSRPETDAWLAFGIAELLAELDSQIHADGTVFEGSTSYHGLSTEIATVAVALIAGLDGDRLRAVRGVQAAAITGWVPRVPLPLPWRERTEHRLTPLPEAVLERLARAAAFTIAVTKPDGHIAQIGDNDSGRVLKLAPTYRKLSVAEARRSYANLDGYDDVPDDATYWAEDHLDHRHVVASVNGLLGQADLTAFAGHDAIESLVIAALAGGAVETRGSLGASGYAAGTTGDDAIVDGFEAAFRDAREADRREVTIPLAGGERPDRLAFPDFGLYLLRTPSTFVSVRCGLLGQAGVGGHDHNDQLSVELWVDGVDISRDPGTAVYTPLPHQRNLYRSRAAHFGPGMAMPEPASQELGLFRLGTEATTECLYWGPRGFLGILRSRERALMARVAWAGSEIRIAYLVSGWTIEARGRGDDGLSELRPDIPFSPGYGIVERTGS